MHTFTLATITLFAGIGLAAPSGLNLPVVHIQYQAAADVIRDQYITADGNPCKANTDLSISHIESFAPPNVNCLAVGSDGSNTYTYGAETVDVGPPQVQDTISCWVAY
ncbi:hypothetical protein BX600DRAFT_508514 [Xylariales sp. PMI_506]|nr:hypothetical protein BX600DRAFT_508514 [Xylariales sp. PMI_506]